MSIDPSFSQDAPLADWILLHETRAGSAADSKDEFKNDCLHGHEQSIYYYCSP